MALIEAAYTILAEIQPATVRAVCYRLFTLGMISSMARNETQRVSVQLRDARENGWIPWEWIVDETRAPERVRQFDDPEAFAQHVQQLYRREWWAGQERLVEVWSEKGTVRGTLMPVLLEFGVMFRVFHGFNSATGVKQVADDTRFEADNPRLALYVGDWDPSGLWMSERDLPARLERYGGNVEIRRLAIDSDDKYDQLPNFSVEEKRDDPRYRWFKGNYGDLCWELDAMSPVVLRDRVAEAIRAEIDPIAWERVCRVERIERESLVTILREWKAATG
jgi:hypothetical protein